MSKEYYEKCSDLLDFSGRVRELMETGGYNPQIVAGWNRLRGDHTSKNYNVSYLFLGNSGNNIPNLHCEDTSNIPIEEDEPIRNIVEKNLRSIANGVSNLKNTKFTREGNKITLDIILNKKTIQTELF